MHCRKLEGPALPEGWGSINKLGDEKDVITVEVNNILTEKKVTNVFGVIKGIVDSGQTYSQIRRDFLFFFLMEALN